LCYFSWFAIEKYTFPIASITPIFPMMIALDWQFFGVFVPKTGQKQEILQKI
jgi:hypothetical protein